MIFIKISVYAQLNYRFSKKHFVRSLSRFVHAPKLLAIVITDAILHRDDMLRHLR